jgi:ABC-type uncharacterized transport system involved in gliding motility auxiliary subunit
LHAFTKRIQTSQEQANGLFLSLSKQCEIIAISIYENYQFLIKYQSQSKLVVKINQAACFELSREPLENVRQGGYCFMLD